MRSQSEDLSQILMCDDGLSNPLEIHISCKDLPSLDFSSKTDPFAVVYVQNKGTTWIEVGRTEQIRDSLNPAFVKQITMKYLFEVRQMVFLDTAKSYSSRSKYGTATTPQKRTFRHKSSWARASYLSVTWCGLRQKRFLW